jgi:PmbA protein
MARSGEVLLLDELDQTAQYLLNKAKVKGIDQAEVQFVHSMGYALSARIGQLENLEQRNDRSLSLTLYHKDCVASVSSTDWTNLALDQAFEKAASLVTFVQPDSCQGLADKKELGFEYPELDLYHPTSEPMANAIETVIAMDNAVTESDSRILHSEACELTTSNVACYYANSNDFRGGYRYTKHRLSCSAVAESDAGKQVFYDYDVHCQANQLVDPLQLAKKTGMEACRRLNPRKIKTQRCPVVFHAAVSNSLFNCFFSAINGNRIYRDSSFLKDSLGKLVLPETLSLWQRPHQLRSLFSAPFDDEGVRTREYALVEQGRFHQFVCNSYAARRLGCAVTGNAGGLFNVEVDSPTVSYTDLLAQMGTGLLITDLMGQGINLINGDYSKGASGFWVERGEIQYPVDGLTVAGQLPDMLSSIVALGDDIDARGSIKTGSLLVEAMTVSCR